MRNTLDRLLKRSGDFSTVTRPTNPKKHDDDLTVSNDDGLNTSGIQNDDGLNTSGIQNDDGLNTSGIQNDDFSISNVQNDDFSIPGIPIEDFEHSFALDESSQISINDDNDNKKDDDVIDITATHAGTVKKKNKRQLIDQLKDERWASYKRLLTPRKKGKCKLYDHFELNETNARYTKVVCKYCHNNGWQNNIRNKPNTDMTEHLLYCEAFAKANPVEALRITQAFASFAVDDNDDPNSSVADPPRKKAKRDNSQPKITEASFKQEPRIKHAKTNSQITMMIAKMFVLCGFSFVQVTNPWFQALMNLIPGYKSCCRSSLNKAVEKHAEIARKEIQDAINESNYLTLISDGWSNCGHLGLYSFNFVNECGKEFYLGLSDYGRKADGEWIKQTMVKLIKKNNVNVFKIFVVASDGCATMNLYRKKMISEFPWMLSVKCYTHGLNNIFKCVMEIEEFKTIHEDCAIICNLFRNVIGNVKLLGKALPSSTKTRFSTSFYVLKAVLQNKQQLLQINADYGKEIFKKYKHLISKIGIPGARETFFWKDLADAVTVLEPLAILITRSEAPYWSLSDSFVQYIVATRDILALAEKSPYLDGCYNKICAALDIGFERYCNPAESILATIFDISVNFNPSIYAMSMVKNLLMQLVEGAMIRKFRMTNIALERENHYSLVAKRKKVKDIVWEKFQQFVANRSNYVGRDFNTFWKSGDNKKLYGEIPFVLKSAVPNSICAERTFSIMGWFCSKRRNRLSDKTIDNMSLIYNQEKLRKLEEAKRAIQNATNILTSDAPLPVFRSQDISLDDNSNDDSDSALEREENDLDSSNAGNLEMTTLTNTNFDCDSDADTDTEANIMEVANRSTSFPQHSNTRKALDKIRNLFRNHAEMQSFPDVHVANRSYDDNETRDLLEEML
ncbi:unnamed protein product [Ambrosiozyma monospora]|uniref:Unnamed protein product n=1 Tax=Ambrosiozyma monospora TaxID=43982 RepID=A0A9W6YX81_AMBMO|nr:unnamed protein product [Ambrosiozyma monospora]